MSSAGESVAASVEPAVAALRVETAIGFILAGMQSLAGAARPPGPEPEPDQN